MVIRVICVRATLQMPGFDASSFRVCFSFLLFAICSLQVKHLGSGSFGEAKLMRYKPNGELVAVKFIEKGYKVRGIELAV